MAVIGTRLRVTALRLGFRTVFGLPRSVKRLLAGPQVRVEDQGLDLDVQLLYRIGSLLSRREGGALDQATLAEQRRQADLSARHLRRTSCSTRSAPATWRWTAPPVRDRRGSTSRKPPARRARCSSSSTAAASRWAA